MTSLLKILIYISASSGQETEDELHYILNRSRKANSDRDITGMLLYHEGNIMQILEGPNQAVDELFSKIRNDERHRNVTVMYEQSISERMFPEFSMGYKQLRSVEFTSIGSFDCTPFIQPLIQEDKMEALKPAIRTQISAFRKVAGLET